MSLFFCKSVSVVCFLSFYVLVSDTGLVQGFFGENAGLIGPKFVGEECRNFLFFAPA